MINEDAISKMKDGVKILNFSRGEVADVNAVLKMTESGKIGKYVCDFPTAEILNKKNIICIPHLGASTEEAEDNCAVMVAKQIVDFVENGNIVNSVNYPSVKLEGKFDKRMLILFDATKTDGQKLESEFSFEEKVCAVKGGYGALLMGGKDFAQKELFGAIKTFIF